MKIYTLRSKSLSYHNLPFFEESDVAALNRVRNCVLANADLSLNINLPDLELICHGEFDCEKGFRCAKSRHVMDLCDLAAVDELAAAWKEKNNVPKSDEQA